MTELDENKISLVIDSVKVLAKVYRGTKTFKILFESPFIISTIVYDVPYFAIESINKRLENERQTNGWSIHDQNENYVRKNFHKAIQFFTEKEKIKLEFKHIKPKLLELEEKIIHSKLQIKTYKSVNKSLLLDGKVSQQNYQKNLKYLKSKVLSAELDLSKARSEFIRAKVPHYNVMFNSEILQLIE